MMDHLQYRTAVLADPNDPAPELREHRENCAECGAFTQKLQGFESRLARALRIDVPPAASADVVLLAPRRRQVTGGRWMALAASALFGAILVGTIWVAIPTRSLAAAVVAHMAGEPDAWQSGTAVPADALNAVLRGAKVKLMPQAGEVSYASSCPFRGYVVPHLVVQSDSGPVTVMVLVHETKAKRKQFDEQGYRGEIVPVQGHGALAILMQDPRADAATVDKIAAKVRESIVWER
jgi:Protein of unknown function (DUF3379)